MHAKIFFDGVTGGALSYADMFDDIMDLICGETSFSNLRVGTEDTEGHIVSTVAAGWTLVSRDDTSAPGYIYYILSAPVAGASTKLKYMLYRCNVSNGEFYWASADARDGSSTTTLLNTENADVVGYNESSASNYIINSQAYYIYLSISPRNIGIMVGYSTYSSQLSSEYEWQQSAFLRTISKDEDFCPMVHYDGSAPRSDSLQPLPHPWSDDPSRYMEVLSSDGVNDTDSSQVTYILGGGASWFSDLGDAQVVQNDASSPYVFHKPWACCGRIILGKMCADVPWYRLDNTNAPSSAPGDEVTITPVGGGAARTFVVWATAWGSSTTVPLYVEKI